MSDPTKARERRTGFHQALEVCDLAGLSAERESLYRDSDVARVNARLAQRLFRALDDGREYTVRLAGPVWYREPLFVDGPPLETVTVSALVVLHHAEDAEIGEEVDFFALPEHDGSMAEMRTRARLRDGQVFYERRVFEAKRFRLPDGTPGACWVRTA